VNEVVKMVAEKTGLSEDKAQIAVNLVVDFLKSKLPQPIASQIDGVMSGNMAGMAGDAAKGLGGLFGKK